MNSLYIPLKFSGPGLQPLNFTVLNPGASAQADIDRAFGALKTYCFFVPSFSAEGAIPYQPGAEPQELIANIVKG